MRKIMARRVIKLDRSTESANWIKSLRKKKSSKKEDIKKSDDVAEMLTLLSAVEHLNDTEQE